MVSSGAHEDGWASQLLMLDGLESRSGSCVEAGAGPFKRLLHVSGLSREAKERSDIWRMDGFQVFFFSCVLLFSIELSMINDKT